MLQEQNDWKRFRQNKIKEYIVFSYIISLLLLGLIIKEYIFLNENSVLSFNSFIFILFITAIYLITRNVKNIKILVIPAFYNYINFIIFISFITFLIYFNASSNQEVYKVYYFLPVVLSTVKFGQKYGFFTAAFSGVNLFLLDYFGNGFLNFNFNILIIILLFWIAWLIGGFTDLERGIQKKLEELVNREKRLKEERERSLKKATDLAIKLNKVNQELKESQKLFKLNFEESNVGMAITDPTGKLLKVNRAISRMLGYEEEELLRREYRGTVFQEDLPDLNKIYYKMIYGEIDTDNSVVKFNHKKEGYVWVSQNITLARDEGGKPLYFLIQAEDITEKKQAKEKIEEQQKALEYNRVKNQFFAKVSHELKTPLNLIFMAVHMLKKEQEKALSNKGNVKKSSFRYIRLIKQNGYRLLRLVNNVIDLTKIDTDSFEINIINYDIVAIIKKIIFSTRDYIESKDRKFEFDSQVKEKVMACDPFNIERILLNLISNAVKFTEPGDKIKIKVVEKNNNIIISVKDTGIGIKEEKQAMIFESFRQVDESFSRRAEGSGIGLSIVKSLVELHGGSIDLKSKYSKGSEFIIKLPVRTVAEKKEVETRHVNNNLIDKIDVEFSDIYDV